MSYAVFVTFHIKSGQTEKFLPLMHEQAANSLVWEPGCAVFEVWTSSARPGLVQLYEIYDDEDAFALHLASDHFKSFDQAVANMIEDKIVVTTDRCGQEVAKENE